jgi:hypothetical protein
VAESTHDADIKTDPILTPPFGGGRGVGGRNPSPTGVADPPECGTDTTGPDVHITLIMQAIRLVSQADLYSPRIGVLRHHKK